MSSVDFMDIALNESFYGYVNEYGEKDFRGKAEFVKASQEYADKQSGAHKHGANQKFIAKNDSRHPEDGTEQQTNAYKKAVEAQSKKRESNLKSTSNGKSISKGNSSRQKGRDVYKDNTDDKLPSDKEITDSKIKL